MATEVDLEALNRITDAVFKHKPKKKKAKGIASAKKKIKTIQKKAKSIASASRAKSK